VGLKALRPKVSVGKGKIEVRKVADRFYLSPEWKALVAREIGRRGRRCEECGKTSEDDGSPVRLVGDHVVERLDGGADLDPGNVRLLCCRAGGNGAMRGNCHAAKTAHARRARAAGG
jgi:5-methylcytosine-specific restriction protein A